MSWQEDDWPAGHEQTADPAAEAEADPAAEAEVIDTWQPGQPWPDEPAGAWQAEQLWPPETEAEGEHAIYGLGNAGGESEGSDRTPATFSVDASGEEEEEEDEDEEIDEDDDY